MRACSLRSWLRMSGSLPRGLADVGGQRGAEREAPAYAVAGSARGSFGLARGDGGLAAHDRWRRWGRDRGGCCNCSTVHPTHQPGCCATGGSVALSYKGNDVKDVLHVFQLYRGLDRLGDSTVGELGHSWRSSIATNRAAMSPNSSEASATGADDAAWWSQMLLLGFAALRSLIWQIGALATGWPVRTLWV